MELRRLISVRVLSLICLALALGAWVVSYCDAIYSADGAIRVIRFDRSPVVANGDTYLRARGDERRKGGAWLDLRQGAGGTSGAEGTTSMRATPTSSWARLGFEYHRGRASYQATLYTGPHTTYNSGAFEYLLLAVPYWFVVLLLAIAPAGALIAARRRRRWLRKGLCAGCGYDLRGSTDRCPECGLPIRHGAGTKPAGEPAAEVAAASAP